MDLTQIVILVVAIAVTIYTAGATSELLVAEAGSTFAAGTVGNAAISAAAGGMASSAVTGALTGNFSAENVLKAGLAAALTAGLTSGIGQAIGNDTLAGGQLIDGKWVASQGATSLADKFVGYTVRAGISAGVGQAVYGKDAGAFGTAFRNSLVASASADAANWVGGNSEPGSLQNVLGHAFIGCVAAVATSKDCGSGAVGAGTAAALNPLLDNFTSNDDALLRKAELAGLSTLATGLIASAAGQDLNTAVTAGQNETLNNYLTRSQKTHDVCGARCVPGRNSLQGASLRPIRGDLRQSGHRLRDRDGYRRYWATRENGSRPL